MSGVSFLTKIEDLGITSQKKSHCTNRCSYMILDFYHVDLTNQGQMIAIAKRTDNGCFSNLLKRIYIFFAEWKRSCSSCRNWAESRLAEMGKKTVRDMMASETAGLDVIMLPKTEHPIAVFSNFTANVLQEVLIVRKDREVTHKSFDFDRDFAKKYPFLNAINPKQNKIIDSRL